jgi:ABC-type transport system involved in multi-copper enzyme maturation permease subunit
MAFIGGNLSTAFLLTHSLVLAVLGLIYLGAFVESRGVSDDRSYYAALAAGAAGAIVFLVALGRTVLPPLLYAQGILKPPEPAPYLIPAGMLLMGIGLVYFAGAALLISERPLLVMTRRELHAFFLSPIAYLTLFGFAVMAGLAFLFFVQNLLRAPLEEPVVRDYIWDFWSIISLLFIVPALTMRLFSEEKRSGSLEMLLTAPVDETAVVLSKFLAALVFFLFLWLPWALLLVTLRVESGQAFDYRPLLSFAIALVCTGSLFLSMGLFFSGLTSNQIVSAVLTFAGMLVLTALIILPSILVPSGALETRESTWQTVLMHVAYPHLWNLTLQGRLELKLLVFPVTATIFFLFLSVKVLEARRWI